MRCQEELITKKRISESIFEKEYLQNIDYAVAQSEKFEVSAEKIIKNGLIGSNFNKVLNALDRPKIGRRADERGPVAEKLGLRIQLRRELDILRHICLNVRLEAVHVIVFYDLQNAVDERFVGQLQK